MNNFVKRCAGFSSQKKDALDCTELRRMNEWKITRKIDEPRNMLLC